LSSGYELTYNEKLKIHMTFLISILILWGVLSIPIGVITGRIISSGNPGNSQDD
jgi:hypothetical protein